MPITALPESTVRLLSSPTVITTPVDVVRELLENSIDAGATSIAILVSENTLDRIEVRDNGQGIQPADHNCLGRPGYTSKLASFEELRTLGGATLGFRGQALASANVLGNVTVTTRTAGDPVATVLQLSTGIGGVESQQHRSAPVGTTVSVTGLFSHLPVREQVAVKDAQKTIAKIKHVLHTYALARLQIQLSFKILRGSSKQAWSYPPRPDFTVKQAVVQVFGAEMASQCLLTTRTTETIDSASNDTQRNEELAVEAFLPKPDANLSTISKGPFFSVDSRPVTALHGTMKKLYAVFKAHLTKSLGVSDGHKPLRDPFIRVDIRCSPGSYDLNIEPSKNEVLFVNESKLTEMFERLCSEVYTTQKSLDPFMTIQKRPLIRQTQTRTPPPSSDGPREGAEPTIHRLDEVPPVWAAGPPQTPLPSNQSLTGANSSRADAGHIQQPRMTRGVRESLIHCYECPPELLDMAANSPSKGRSRLRQIRHSRPPIVSSQERRGQSGHPTTEAIGLQTKLWAESCEVSHARVSVKDAQQRRPTVSLGQTPGKGFVVDMSADPDMSSDEEAELLASRFRGLQEIDSQMGEVYENSKEGLNPWSIAKLAAPAREQPGENTLWTGASQDASPYQGSDVMPMFDEAFEDKLPVLRPHGGAPGDLDPPRTTPLGIGHVDHQQHHITGDHYPSPLANIDISRASPRSSPAAHMNPQLTWHPTQSNGRRELPKLRSYHNDAEQNIDPDGLVQTKLSFGGPRKSQNKRNQQSQLHISDTTLTPDPLFRKAKKLKIDSFNPPTTDDVPRVDARFSDRADYQHHDEYLGRLTKDRNARGVSYSPSLASGKSKSCPAQRLIATESKLGRAEGDSLDGDSRKYLMTRQRSEAEHQRRGRQLIKRVKTDSLPLETTPPTDKTRHLVLVVGTDSEKFGEALGNVPEDNAFLTNPRTEANWSADMGPEDVKDIEEKLKSVLSVWTEKRFGEKTEVELNLWSRVKGAAAT